MSKQTALNNTSSRRDVLKAGALAAPVVAISVPAAALGGDAKGAQLARLRDEQAIRGLQRDALLRFNQAGQGGLGPLLAKGARLEIGEDVRAVVPVSTLEEARLELAENGEAAQASLACTIERDASLPQDECTLVQMARLQGNAIGTMAHTGELHARFAKLGGEWRITALGFA